MRCRSLSEMQEASEQQGGSQPALAKKLKILCLHGFRQTGKSFTVSYLHGSCWEG
jgi:hypothetical protein